MTPPQPIEDELLNCPFCGTNPETLMSGLVSCGKPSCDLFSVRLRKEYWNTRHPITPTANTKEIAERCAKEIAQTEELASLQNVNLYHPQMGEILVKTIQSAITEAIAEKEKHFELNVNMWKGMWEYLQQQLTAEREMLDWLSQYFQSNTAFNKASLRQLVFPVTEQGTPTLRDAIKAAIQVMKQQALAPEKEKE